MAEADDDLAHAIDGSKFAHLLKPIRDLAENWGVDIANDLEDYLTHLNRTAFAFNGGPQLDFAEAALVIQSSACVYSRKVDFLHTLVYQALDAVRNKKNATAAGQEGMDGEGGEGVGAAPAGTQRERPGRKGAAHDQDPEEDTVEGFLSAGLQLKSAEDIDLAPVAGEEGGPGSGYTRAPAALLALEDQCSGTGDGDAGFYRLAQCYVHISGALLLDPNDADLYDQMLNNTRRGGKGFGAWLPPEAVLTQTAAQQGAGLQQRKEGEEEDDDDGGGDDGGASDDDVAPALPAVTAGGPAVTVAQQALTYGAVTFAPTIAGGLGPSATAAEPSVAQRAVNQGEEVQQVVAGQVPGQQQGLLAGQVAASAQQQQQEEVFDLYTPLDMDGKGVLPIKPMQVRRPARGKFKPVAVPQTHQNPNAPHLPSSRSRPSITLLNPEFTYGLELLQQLCPAPLPTQRTGRAARGAAATAAAAAAGAAAPGLRPVFDAADAAAAMAELQGAIEAGENEGRVPEGREGQGGVESGAGGWDDGDMGGGDGGGGGMDDDDYGGGDAYGSGLDLANFMGPDVLGGTGPQAAHLEGMDGEGHGDAMPSYEELCRAHMEQLMATAAAQEVQTELAMRVSGWRSKIDPVLREEEARKGFDIQVYQQKIIGCLEEKKKQQGDDADDATTDFQVVAAQTVKWEVSRTFAAMLQLINNRNVHIIQVGPPDAPFNLQLLSSELLHKTMGQRLNAAAGPAQEGDAAGGEAVDEPSGPQLGEGVEAQAARRPSKKARGKSS